MRAFWSDPYLWVHLAGLAAVPVFLEVCLVGLAIGDPLLPGWVEILLVAIAGIAPILWMQWQRPFSIYSLVAVAVTPSQLTDDQRRILKIFKSRESQLLAAIAAVALFPVLVKLYALAPLATTVAPHWWGGRLTGLMVAAIAFLLVNLFIQVPLSVLRALAVSQSSFAETIPYPSEQVGRDFSLLGIGVKKILPPIEMAPPRVKPAPPAPPQVEPVQELSEGLWDEPEAEATEQRVEAQGTTVLEAIAETITEVPQAADETASAESVEAIAGVEPTRLDPLDTDQVEEAIAALDANPEASDAVESPLESPSDSDVEKPELLEDTFPTDLETQEPEPANNTLESDEPHPMELAVPEQADTEPSDDQSEQQNSIDSASLAPGEEQKEHPLPEAPEETSADASSALVADEPAPIAEPDEPVEQPSGTAEENQPAVDAAVDPDLDSGHEDSAHPSANDEYQG